MPFICVVYLLGERAREGISAAEQSREFCREPVHGGIRLEEINFLGLRDESVDSGGNTPCWLPFPGLG